MNTLDFKKLFEAAPALFLVLSTDFTIIGASDAYLEATMTLRENITGKNLFDVFPDNPDDFTADGVSNLRSSLNRVLVNKSPDKMPMQKYDIQKPETEGGGFEERFWSPINSPVLDENNQILYIIHRVEDVTSFIQQKNEQNKISQGWKDKSLEEEKKREEFEAFFHKELEEKIAELKIINNEMEAFSYSISHDLRAPLRAIGGFSNILIEDYNDSLDAEGKRYLHNISESSKKMGKLIDDILGFSRLGRKLISKTNVDMNMLVNSIIQELSPINPKLLDYIEISYLPPVNADRAMLKQALLNLISNAIKFSSNQKKPKIEIGFNSTGNYYYVKDNGVGFNMKYIDKLFNVFQRLHSDTEFEGTGIGLAIVQKVIKKHGGEIWADSKVNEGTIFSFSLP